MKIGGLQPVTLLDYPQKVAAIIFASGCNMRCPFCYNPNLVLPQLIDSGQLLSEVQVLAFLKKRKKYLDGVVMTGGEPLLQSDSLKFLHRLKKIGYQIKLDTNGLAADRLERSLANGLVDYLAMDIKGPLDRYALFSGVNADWSNITKSICLIKNSGLPYEFRSTLVKNLHQPQDIPQMAQLIKGAKKYFLQSWRSDSQLVGGENFSGQSFSAKEMAGFREAAEKWVKKCFIR